MEKFAKLFDSDEYGQLVAMIQPNEEGNPEIRLFLMPKGLGVCSLAISFNDDSEESWASCEKIFEGFDIVKAESMAQSVADQLNSLVAKGK